MSKRPLILLAFVASFLVAEQYLAGQDDEESKPNVAQLGANQSNGRQQSVEPKSVPDEPPTETNADRQQSNPDDALAEMRAQLSRLQAEVDRLKRRQWGRDADKSAGFFTRPIADFEPVELSPIGEADDAEPAAFGPPRFHIDDGSELEEGSLDEFRPIQYEDNQPPSELGAVPGQHIRPRRVDVLGSIGFPEMRPYVPDMGHKKRKLEAEF